MYSHRIRQARDAVQGRFYRTSSGRLVRVVEVTQARRVRVEYWARYGLGWKSTWLPPDAVLTPAPEFTSFPEPDSYESMLLGEAAPDAAGA